MKKIFTIITLLLFIVPLWGVDTFKDTVPKTDDVIIIIKVPRKAGAKSLEPDVPIELSSNGLIRGCCPIYDAGYTDGKIDAETAIRDAEDCLVFMVVPKENVVAVHAVLQSYPTKEVETITAGKEEAAKTEFVTFDDAKQNTEDGIAESDIRAAELAPQ